MIDTLRRGFLFGLGATLVADPKLFSSKLPMLWGDGKHDDYEGLSALLNGKPVKIAQTGDTFRPFFEDGLKCIELIGGTYLVCRGIVADPGPKAEIYMQGAKIVSAPGFRDLSMLTVHQAERLEIRDCEIHRRQDWRSDRNYADRLLSTTFFRGETLEEAA